MKKFKIFFYIFFFVIIITIRQKYASAKLLPFNFKKKWNNHSLPSLSKILKKVTPSVVSIDVQGSTFVSQFKLPPKIQDYLNEHFSLCKAGSPYENTPICGNNNNILEQKFHAIGSGVIINAKNGIIITNNHVINHAKYISVELSNGKTYEAKIIGQDPQMDVALIKIKNNIINLKSLKIANSDNLKVGDYTIAIGNPYGLGETVTSGIISGLGRTGLNIENFENFIQTDAAINRGSSGGALVNLNGDLIGINTAILTPNEGNIGIGFAIPSNTITNLIHQFTKFGKIKRGSLGIYGVDLDPQLAKVMNIHNLYKGTFIRDVIPFKNNPLDPGDVIVSLNNKQVNSYALLKAKISTFMTGTFVKLGIIRKGVFKIIKTKLGDYCSNESFKKNMMYYGIEGSYLVNTDLKNRNVFFKMGKNTAVKVINILPNSPAEIIGLKKDDIILSINRRRTIDIKKVKEILDKHPSLILLYILRGKNKFYLLN
ncbi:trypsin-like serine protease [Enterobacteriaceae endosymbiont of Donacia bicoloricornis]|uniref:trypsin-like peptidase domain-containing protein n=1 Tax=Enterobacteriaceae endosymbiont of Donacia bicoloricornis TaxID=2675772 RepID=UPI001448DEC5|nr:trypsin-like peptidase domain-containing protein [Enterobacteriaceae endosymbiont of Donacia bicoloricornis]QJC37724.1 trypsin-like serine protease [Enterobacteriaceae endosymbiont of Donacia bicoloricornis]